MNRAQWQGPITALMAMLCLAFPGPAVAEEPHGWLLGFFGSHKNSSFSVVADGEEQWSGRYNEDRGNTFEAGYLTPNIKLFGPFGMNSMLRTTWTDFKNQSISEPSGKTESTRTAEVDLNSKMSIITQEATAKLFIGFGSSDSSYLSIGYAGGWVRSDIGGDIYLTHASDRTDRCATAVGTEDIESIESSCEKHTLKDIRTRAVQRIEVMVFGSDKYLNGYILVIFQKPVTMKTGNYAYIFSSNIYAVLGLRW